MHLCTTVYQGGTLHKCGIYYKRTLSSLRAYTGERRSSGRGERLTTLQQSPSRTGQETARAPTYGIRWEKEGAGGEAATAGKGACLVPLLAFARLGVREEAMCTVCARLAFLFPPRSPAKNVGEAWISPREGISALEKDRNYGFFQSYVSLVRRRIPFNNNACMQGHRIFLSLFVESLSLPSEVLHSREKSPFCFSPPPFPPFCSSARPSVRPGSIPRPRSLAPTPPRSPPRSAAAAAAAATEALWKRGGDAQE